MGKMWIKKKYPKELGKSLVDEDEWDEDGEDFLSEAGDISDEEASFHRHDDHHDQYEPHAHPGPANNVLNVLRIAELEAKKRTLMIKDAIWSFFSRFFFL